MAVLKDLPPEILQEIFAFVQNDGPPAILIACSVVSRLWRDIALPRLFFTFRTHRTESFTDVAHFLSTHAHIAACVKYLGLERTGSMFPGPGKALPNPEIDPYTAHTLLKCSPALRALSFHGVKFVAQPIATTNTDALTDDWLRPYHLQWVNLNSCTIGHDPTPVFRILSQCDIDTFRMTLTEFPDEPLESTVLHQTLRVRKLWLGLHSLRKPEQLIGALRRHLEPGFVRELNVWCDNQRSLESVGALLQDVGRNLTVLKLSLLWGADAAKASCTTLETFHLLPFTFMIDNPGMAPSTACANISRFLAPSVRTIVLQLQVQADEAGSKRAESFGLGELDEAVMKDKQRRFPELEKVTLQFVYCREGQLGAWSTAGKRAMPRLDGAGILHVTCSSL
ncbi:hypothetical protein V8D89_002755 [Ganoderma adspersum]